MKRGWWKVSFDVTVDGKTVDVGRLSEKNRRKIFKMIGYGCVAGEIECEPGEIEEDGYE